MLLRNAMNSLHLLQLLLVLGLTLLRSHVRGGCQQMDLPPILQECYDNMNGYDQEVVGETAVESCINNYMWKTFQQHCISYVDSGTANFISYIWNKYTDNPNSRSKRQTFPGPGGKKIRRCIRKEVRQLKKTSWKRIHRAINKMKADTSLLPNKYEAIARIHNGRSSSAAHGGQSFLGWHTIYLLLLEFSLREYDDRICLPYWDTTLDAYLPDPHESVFFHLTGGAVGPLQYPFQNWTFLAENDVSRIMVFRNARGSFDKDLLLDYSEYEELRNIQSTSDMSQVSSEKFSKIIEYPHNNLHIYLRGTVLNLFTAAQDFIFFLLHGLVEQIFDRNLRSLRRRKRQKYPRPGNGYPEDHGPDDPMGILGKLNISGINETIKNRDAYLPKWRKYFKYKSSPSCKNNCKTPGRYLKCCKAINRCVSKVIKNGKPVMDEDLEIACSQDSDSRKKRSSDDILSSFNHPASQGAQYPVQNDFLLNGVPDSDLWVYVAVLITHNRAHENRYQCFSVTNGELKEESDIYDPSANDALNDTVKSGHAKRLRNCESSKSGSSYVFVRTVGINYCGLYEDYAVIDNRLPVSRSVVYVAIKRPTEEEDTEVMFTAYDACGRICSAYCPNMESSYPPYVHCSGTVTMDNKPPWMYRDTLGETMAMYWEFPEQSIPHQRPKVFYTMNFLCNGFTYFSRQP